MAEDLPHPLLSVTGHQTWVSNAFVTSPQSVTSMKLMLTCPFLTPCIVEVGARLLIRLHFVANTFIRLTNIVFEKPNSIYAVGFQRGGSVSCEASLDSLGQRGSKGLYLRPVSMYSACHPRHHLLNTLIIHPNYSAWSHKVMWFVLTIAIVTCQSFFR